MLSIDEQAQAIAEALSPSKAAQAARWRWGTVRTVNSDGTMNVAVGGAELPSIRAAQHAMGAKVGDRVRVAYYGTDAIVDAVRATAKLMSLPKVDGNLEVSGNLSSANITSSGYIQAGGSLKANSGAVTLRDPRLDRDGTAPSSAVYSYVLGILDKDSELMAYLQAAHFPTGNVQASLVANAENNGANVYNTLSVLVKPDGTRSYGVTDPAAFRSAIAAASLAANTYSGVQTTNGNQFVGKSTNITSNTVPSSGTNGNGAFRLADSANNTVGYICMHFGADNIQWLTMYAQRYVGGTNKFSTLRLGIDSSGNARVVLEGTKVRQAWNTALRQVLYNNTTGTNGNVTLSETAANFGHLTIYYRTNDNFHSSVDVFAPNGKIVSLQSIGINNAGNNMYLKSRTVTINGTSITKNGEGSAVLWSASTGYPSASTDIYITRVEGW